MKHLDADAGLEPVEPPLQTAQPGVTVVKELGDRPRCTKCGKKGEVVAWSSYALGWE